MKKKYSLELGIDKIILQVINDFGNPQIDLDDRLSFYDVEHLKDEYQDYVIRFRKDKLMLPSGKVLPCITPDDKYLGKVEILEILAVDVIDLTDVDAQRCYYENKEQLIGRFAEVFDHKFKPDDCFVIYKLGKFEEA